MQRCLSSTPDFLWLLPAGRIPGTAGSFDPAAALWPPRIALRLRRESRMTLGCITQRLQMGTKMYLSLPLYCQGRERTKQR
jgi:hypothetical protein